MKKIGLFIKSAVEGAITYALYYLFTAAMLWLGFKLLGNIHNPWLVVHYHECLGGVILFRSLYVLIRIPIDNHIRAKVKKRLHYNKVEKADERAKVVALTLGEENKVVNTMNLLLDGYTITEVERERLQRFIYNYENLSHHRATTVGLWATDQPEKLAPYDKENLLFEIK